MFRRTWRKIFYLLCFFIGLFVRQWFSCSVSIALKKKKRESWNGLGWKQFGLNFQQLCDILKQCLQLLQLEQKGVKKTPTLHGGHSVSHRDFQIHRWLRQRLLSCSALLALGNVPLVHCCYIILSSTGKRALLRDQCAIIFPVVSHHIVKVR